MKKIILILIVSFLLVGCDYKFVKIEDTTQTNQQAQNTEINTDDSFKKKANCIKYRDAIVKSIEEEAKNQSIEGIQRTSADLDEIMYSSGENSCLFSYTLNNYDNSGINYTTYIIKDYLTNEVLTVKSWFKGIDDIHEVRNDFEIVKDYFKK